MAWTTPRTWVADELVTASLMNTHIRDNLNALKTPPSGQVARDNNADYTTTSTSFVDVDGTNLIVTITTTGGDVLVWFDGVAYNNGANYTEFTVYETSDKGLADGLTLNYGSTIRSVGFVYLITGLSAGSHTFKLRWRVTGGTGTLYSGSGSTPDVPVVFGAREI